MCSVKCMLPPSSEHPATCWESFMSKKALLQTCPTLPETNIFAPPQKWIFGIQLSIFFWDAIIFRDFLLLVVGSLLIFLASRFIFWCKKIAGFLWWKTPLTGGWSTFMPLVAACSSAQVTNRWWVLVKGTPCQKCPQLSGFRGVPPWAMCRGGAPDATEMPLIQVLKLESICPDLFFFSGVPYHMMALGNQQCEKKCGENFQTQRNEETFLQISAWENCDLLFFLAFSTAFSVKRW